MHTTTSPEQLEALAINATSWATQAVMDSAAELYARQWPALRALAADDNQPQRIRTAAQRLEATLQHMRNGGLLRDAGERVDQLETQRHQLTGTSVDTLDHRTWMSAIVRELRTLQAVRQLVAELDR